MPYIIAVVTPSGRELYIAFAYTTGATIDSFFELLLYTGVA